MGGIPFIFYAALNPQGRAFTQPLHPNEHDEFMNKGYLIGLAAVAAFSTATAQVTTVIDAPSAGVQPESQVLLHYWLRSTSSNLDSKYLHLFKGVIGFGYNFEGGLQTDFNGSTMFGGKYQFYRGENGLRAAVGVTGLGEDGHLFLAGDKVAPDYILTAGFMDRDGATGYLGASTQWRQTWRFSAEYIGSRDGQFGLRAQHRFWKPGLSLDLRALFPNRERADTTYWFGLNYVTSIKP